MRVQIFDKNGNFLDQWNNMHRACALCIDKDQTIYLGEIGSSGAVNRELPNIGPRVSIYETNGDLCISSLSVCVGVAAFGVGPRSRKWCTLHPPVHGPPMFVVARLRNIR